VGDWPLDESDDLLPVQADGDPELEVLARKGDLLGVLNLMPVNYAFLLRVDPGELMPSDPPRFRRGDVNLSRTVDISDAVRLLNFLFLGDSISCADAADANDSGRLDIADSVYILLFLFMHGQSPAPPGPFVPGIDPTIDALGCGNA
jgi:hypothetical protein